MQRLKPGERVEPTLFAAKMCYEFRSWAGLPGGRGEMRRVAFLVGLAAMVVVSAAVQASVVVLPYLPPAEPASTQLSSWLGLKAGPSDPGGPIAQIPDLAAGLGSPDFTSGLGQAQPLAAFNPQLAGMESGFADATIALASDLHLQLGATVDQDQMPDLQPLSGLDRLELSRVAQDAGARSGQVGLDFTFAPWGSLGLSVSQSQLGYAALGSSLMLQSSGLSATTAAISARLSLGDGWVTNISYDQGRSQLDLRPNGFVAKNDASGYEIAVAKYGLFGADSLGLAMVRPAVPTAELTPQAGYSGLLGNMDPFSDQKPETDLELGYETSFNGNITLEANAGYQMNVAGQTGANGVSVLSRAKINF